MFAIWEVRAASEQPGGHRVSAKQNSPQPFEQILTLKELRWNHRRLSQATFPHPNIKPPLKRNNSFIISWFLSEYHLWGSAPAVGYEGVNGSVNLQSHLDKNTHMQHCILLNNQCLIDTNVSLYDLSGCEWNKLAFQLCWRWRKRRKRQVALEQHLYLLQGCKLTKLT